MPQKVNPAIGTTKFMLTAIWGVNGFHLLDLMSSQCRFNAQYFVEHAMAPLIHTIFPQGRTAYTPRLNICVDNCRYHFSKVIEQFLSISGSRMFPTQLIVPTWPIGILAIGVSRLDSLAKVLPSLKNYRKGFENFWRKDPAAKLTDGFKGWFDRMRWAIAHNGQY
jgi:hypothetical protein